MPNYKINVAIIVFYQTSGARTGRTIQMDVYDETQAKDIAQSGTMTEIGTTGRYYKTFTPDAVGYWNIMCYDTVGMIKGHVLKTYKIITEDLDTIGTQLDDIEAETNKIQTIDDNVDAIKLKTDLIGASVAPANEYDTELDQSLSTTESNIRGTDGDDLKSLSDQIDGIDSPAKATVFFFTSRVVKK